MSVNCKDEHDMQTVISSERLLRLQCQVDAHKNRERRARSGAVGTWDKTRWPRVEINSRFVGKGHRSPFKIFLLPARRVVSYDLRTIVLSMRLLIELLENFPYLAQELQMSNIIETVMKFFFKLF